MQSTTDRRLRTKLTSINKTIREGRPPFDTAESENVALHRMPILTGSPRRVSEMYKFWFRTRGCTFDRAGQCSMCNYGVGPEIDAKQMARAVRWQIAGVPEGSSIYVSPSGSLLDPREVPRDLLRSVLTAAARRKPVALAFETRPELCGPEIFDELRELVPRTTRVVVEMGVESWTPEIRMMCHLKPSPQSAYERAVALAREYDFDTIANITMGGLGLTHAAAYADTLASVRGARVAGFTTKMVFPLSAKAGSLLGWAHDNGLWEPPSLWMLVRALADLSSPESFGDGISDLDISWYDPDLDGVTQARPDGCAECRPMLVDVLVRFHLDPRIATLRPALDWSRCDCPAQADRMLSASPADALWKDRLAEVADRWDESNGDGDRRLLPLVPSAGH
ncbi:radical SAM protein [Amycolatopsis sp. NBC_00345]|uniref:radical SAM protein n=1 Tax=Amycolatopsis sp. NBC_00345 TaxID=2975955 RepID=UPI002E26810F